MRVEGQRLRCERADPAAVGERGRRRGVGLVVDRDFPGVGAGLGEIDVEQHLGAEIVVDDQRRFCRSGGGRGVRPKAGWPAATTAASAGRLAVKRPLRRRHRGQLGLRDQHRLEAAEAVGDGARRAVRRIVAHQVEAGGVDQPAVAIGHERAGAGQERRAARILDDEEAVAVDGEIGGGGGVFQVALLRDRSSGSLVVTPPDV